MFRSHGISLNIACVRKLHVHNKDIYKYMNIIHTGYTTKDEKEQKKMTDRTPSKNQRGFCSPRMFKQTSDQLTRFQDKESKSYKRWRLYIHSNISISTNISAISVIYVLYKSTHIDVQPVYKVTLLYACTHNVYIYIVYTI